MTTKSVFVDIAYTKSDSLKTHRAMRGDQPDARKMIVVDATPKESASKVWVPDPRRSPLGRSTHLRQPRDVVTQSTGLKRVHVISRSACKGREMFCSVLNLGSQFRF